ncbi:hypothetical protein XCR1_810040 [Xenorhabdus cabanillasii JM26]|uniref:Uncharacterized protein n=1 Tax=Xenorhabdus cabanillasii JM26 TaxID=1427517 RepID=W1J8C0_9GAMM|nr:hypothetical protein XCR1_810040 [Xenorhabdus cabanillasii JM26]
MIVISPILVLQYYNHVRIHSFNGELNVKVKRERLKGYLEVFNRYTFNLHKKV